MEQEIISKQLWYHGTRYNYDNFSEISCQPSNYSNAGLGIFLATDINVANTYCGDNGYLLTVEIKENFKCYYATEEEFWYPPYKIEEEDFDMMGELTIYPGEKMRKDLVSKGYDVLFYHDLNEMENVLVILNNDIAKIIQKTPMDLLKSNNSRKNSL